MGFYIAMGSVVFPSILLRTEPNHSASSFRLDPTSPDYVEEQDPDWEPEECDYQILRKDI